VTRRPAAQLREQGQCETPGAVDGSCGPRYHHHSGSRNGGGLVGLVRALIVSDLRVYRDGLSAALRTDPGISVVGVAAHPNEATHRVTKTSPTVLVMDTRMPDGVAVVKALRALDDRIQIVGLGAHDDLIPMCVEAGIDNYLPPEASLSDIRRAVANVPSDRCLGDEETDEPGPGGDDATPFTRRELDVLALLRRGQSNKEIAASLYISESTAKNHVHSILQKARLRNRCQVFALADPRSASWPDRSGS
jgi:DNA-binding NarL/FixJ family response regulator